jgi:hypothetical protein
MKMVKIKNSILKTILRKILRKEVIKMKKLIMVVMAIAMVAVFLPKAEAGDSAQLGLQVTFAPSEPLKIWSEPEGPFTVETGKTVEFKVVAEDKDAAIIGLDLKHPVEFPEGFEWIPPQGFVEPKYKVEGYFKWTPRGDIEPKTYAICFVADSFTGENWTGQRETVELRVEITVRPAPVIAIELEGPNPWVLDGVKLGERCANVNTDGAPMHKIHNTGNVPVVIDIGYGIMVDVYLLPHPGLEQGRDTYITLCGDVAIPPNERIKVLGIGPNEGAPLSMTYGAPTALSQPVQGMGAGYEIRAYADPFGR